MKFMGLQIIMEIYLMDCNLTVLLNEEPTEGSSIHIQCYVINCEWKVVIFEQIQM